MKVLVTGGGGFLGLRLARALLERGALTGFSGKPEPLARLTLLDLAFPDERPRDSRLVLVEGDLAERAVLERALEADTASVFHLAAAVSGAAEADFDLGMRVNLDGTRLLLERLRHLARPARLVYASSVAAFGGALPPVLNDATTPTPQTSYGTQKVIGEHLVADYTRRGFLDGRSLRLPAIVVRPGRPNAAASSFASSLIREPLAGCAALCPVPPETRVWLLSPARATEAFIHAHELEGSAWPASRVVNLPGISVTVSEMLATLARLAGPQVASRVDWTPDERVRAIVRTWPVRFETPRALAMGFRADPDFESVVRAYAAEQGIRLAA